MKFIGTIFLSLFLFQINAQTDLDQAVGNWEGGIQLPDGSSFPIIFHIVKNDDKLSATMDSPSQSAFGLKMDKTEFKDNQITLTMNQVQGNYKGTLKEGKFEGTWTQAGQSFPLNLERMKKKGDD